MGCAGAHADQSLCWVHLPFCQFDHAIAYLVLIVSAAAAHLVMIVSAAYLAMILTAAYLVLIISAVTAI